MENDDNHIAFLFFSALIKEGLQDVDSSYQGLFSENKHLLEQIAENYHRVIYMADHAEKNYLFISRNAPEIIGVSHLKKNIDGELTYAADFLPINHKRALRFLMQIAYKKVAVAFTKNELLNIKYTLTFDADNKEGKRKFFLQKGKILDIGDKVYMPVESGLWVNISHWKTNPYQYLYLKSANKSLFLYCDPTDMQVSVLRLSKAQLKILRALAEGNNLERVANVLHLSIHTVQTHCKNMLSKTRFSSRSALLHFAVEAGII